MTIKFTIHGNQNDPTGNPIPKIKKTRNSYWTPQAQRYAKWKEYVVFEFLKAVKTDTELLNQTDPSFLLYEKTYTKHGKPILLPSDSKARMNIKIFYANELHADPENVFGSVADALFVNDKHLAGSFDFEHEAGKGRVEAEMVVEAGNLLFLKNSRSATRQKR